MSYTNGLDKPTDYFNTKLWTGNGSTQSITGVGFQPDWTWIKERNGSSGHVLIDSVRGVDKVIRSNQTGAESTDDDCITSFDTDGYSLGDDVKTNESSSFTYVGWSWLAGGTASSNTDGTITSTVSANTTAGFSIVSYTGNGTAGATVGHGIDTPKMYIVKRRSNTGNWYTYHESIGNTNRLRLDETSTSTTESTAWNNTSPTSSVFSLGTSVDVNASGQTYIAYCFAEKKGFSKMGSYVGNNNDDGTFVYLGFKPAFLLIKIIDTQTDNWIMQDNKRNTSNLSTSQRLRANSSGAEFSSSNEIDLLSNGFKVHGADGEINGSGASYIYMAFAESPFVTSTGIPTTAR